MGFNAGAFAGALGQSALSTYERIGEEELRALQRSQIKKDIAEKEALDQAWRESQSRVGQQDDYAQAIKAGGAAGSEQARMLSNQGALPGNTPEDQAFERASAEAATGALRENAVRQGAIPESKAALPELKPTEYTAKQGMNEYLKAAGQVSRKGTLEALQLKNVMREADIQDKFDASKEELDNTLAKIHGIGESQGLKGLAEAASKEGLKVKFVEGKNGIGSRIQVLGPKGDVLETISDVGSATDKLSKAAMQQFYDKSLSLLGSPDKVIAAMQGERKTKAAETSAQADLAYKSAYADYLKGGKGGAGGGTSGALYKKAEELAADKTSKFYGKKEDAYEFLKRGAVKNDDAITWNDIEKKLRGDGASAADIAAQRAGFFGPERGYAPQQAIAVLQSGKDPKTGQTLSDAQLNEFNRKFPKTPWQDILGEDNKPKPPPPTHLGGGQPVPR
jgi:hypothetical protein